MKKGSFLAGMFTMLLIVSLVSTAAAVSATVSKELTYRDIKIMMNGQKITPKDANGNVVEPFIIDGTTYLPVRAVGDAMGLNVGWNGETNTVTLNTPEYQDAIQPPESTQMPADTLPVATGRPNVGDIVTIGSGYAFDTDGKMVEGEINYGWGSNHILCYDVSGEVYVDSVNLFLAYVFNQKSVLEGHTVITNDDDIQLYEDLKIYNRGSATEYIYEDFSFMYPRDATGENCQVGEVDGCLAVNAYGIWIVNANDLLEKFGVDKTISHVNGEIVIK